ncbi:MAG: trimeric intracellular cation channel family protein [Clostridia bacterium]|nr:trimeric intracellular cation channel family protein [Clostridia bacterium]
MLDWLEAMLHVAEIVGTVAFAASGAMMAIDRELDLFGVLFLGITAAVGGGIVRDLFLGITPPGAFRNSIFVAVAAVTAIVVFLYAWLRKNQYKRHYLQLDHAINLVDAIGLGVFGVLGVEAAMNAGHGDNLFLCVFMGMTTGVGGGILRDVFSRTVPAVLHKRIYAVAVIAGSLVYYGIRQTALPVLVSMIAGTTVTVVIRICSSHFRWDLPVVRLEK